MDLKAHIRQIPDFPKPGINFFDISTLIRHAAPLAIPLNCGTIMIRKSGKLPGKVKSHSYGLEYGTDTVEIQHDAVDLGQRVVIVDDRLATGGTVAAAAALLRGSGAEVVGATCVIELTFLKARARLDISFESLLQYDSD